MKETNENPVTLATTDRIAGASSRRQFARESSDGKKQKNKNMGGYEFVRKQSTAAAGTGLFRSKV